MFPLDGELNPPKGCCSHGLGYRAAEEAAVNSFDEAVANIEKTTGAKVPKRQLEEIAVVAARDFEEFYSTGKTEEAGPTSDIPVMSVDQKGIVMRREDLRGATRKAVEESVRRPGARFHPGEKLHRKRMATVAAVYDIKADERNPEEVMGLCATEEKSARPRATHKRVWASVEQDPKDVIQDMFDEALGRDPEKKRPWGDLG